MDGSNTNACNYRTSRSFVCLSMGAILLMWECFVILPSSAVCRLPFAYSRCNIVTNCAILRTGRALVDRWVYLISTACVSG